MENNIYLDNDLLELEGIEEARTKIWDHYIHNELRVPRVTHIIKQCVDQTNLIAWAAKVGYSKQNYYRNKALEIGTAVHELIDRYLMSKYVYHDEFTVDYSEYMEDYRSSIYNCIENFKLWCKRLEDNMINIEVLYIEETVSCPWYAGTIDAILKINGANYIVDFKTSKEISSEYLLQTSAYMWIINNGYTPHIPHIDGIGIIRVNKNAHNSFEDLFLNDFDPSNHNMIINFQNCFASFVNSYYRSININYLTDIYYNQYIPVEIFNNGESLNE